MSPNRLLNDKVNISVVVGILTVRKCAYGKVLSMGTIGTTVLS